MKKLFLLNFIFIQSVYAEPEIIITNNTENEINITYTYLKKNNYLHNTNTKVAPYSSFIAETKRYVINNNYLLEFIDTHKACSWLYSFGFRHANGWGIDLIINGEKIITICANKYSPLDYRNHAQLIYVQEKNKIEKFVFKNLGWWEQNNEFQTSFILNLEKYKNNYSKSEINWFVYNGELTENWQNQAKIP